MEFKLRAEADLIGDARLFKIGLRALGNAARILVERPVVRMIDDLDISDHGERPDLHKLIDVGTCQIGNEDHIAFFDGREPIVAAIKSDAVRHGLLCKAAGGDREVPPAAVKVDHHEVDHLDISLFNETFYFIKCRKHAVAP